MFTVDGVSYDWLDVGVAAALWGNWKALERQVAEGLAWCSGAPGQTVDPAVLHKRAERFRQRRGLLSADEMQVWLQRWHLTSAAWMDYLRRAHLREVNGAGPVPVAPPLGDEEMATAVHAEAVCSGRLEAWATKLAGRAAAPAAAPDACDHDPANVDLPKPELGRAMPPIPPDVLRARTGHLTELESAFERYRATVVTSEAIHAEVRARTMDWLRVDCEYLTVPHDDAAREVTLSLRLRERTLADLARECGSDLQRRSLRIDALSPDLGAALFSARAGDVLGPLRHDDGFLVLEVIGKTEPSPDDPEVRDEAARRVLDRAVHHLVNESVVWHEHL